MQHRRTRCLSLTERKRFLVKTRAFKALQATYGHKVGPAGALTLGAYRADYEGHVALVLIDRVSLVRQNGLLGSYLTSFSSSLPTWLAAAAPSTTVCKPR